MRLSWKLDSFAALRKRMIRETEQALLLGLLFPQSAPRIPTIEVGRGSFAPDFAEQFWFHALDLADADRQKLASA